MKPEQLRQLDYELAVGVMGWTLVNYETGEADPDAWPDAQSNDGWSWEGQDEGLEAYEWSPTEDPVDSKALREKLAERWDWLLGSGKVEPTEKEFGFALYKKGTRSAVEVAIAEADTEELAVCLCAAKAYGLQFNPIGD